MFESGQEMSTGSKCKGHQRPSEKGQIIVIRKRSNLSNVNDQSRSCLPIQSHNGQRNFISILREAPKGRVSVGTWVKAVSHELVENCCTEFFAQKQPDMEKFVSGQFSNSLLSITGEVRSSSTNDHMRSDQTHHTLRHAPCTLGIRSQATSRC